MSDKTLQELTSKYTGRVANLFSLGRDAALRAEYISYVKKFGLTHEDIPQLLKLAQDKEIYNYEYEEDENDVMVFYGVIHARYALSELKVPEFKDILIQMVEDGDDDDYDDWILDDFTKLIRPYRKEMYDYFAKSILNSTLSSWTRLSYIDTIREMLQVDEVSLDEVKVLIEKVLLTGENPIVNAHVIGLCVDYKLIEFHEHIKACFERDAVDLAYMGDLEDVEIALGLREERETKRRPTPIQELIQNYESDLIQVPETFVKKTPKVGRNDPCPCGSGKKYKKCCLNK